MTVRRAAQSMFERFTDRARRVVVLAQEEARMLNHNYIGTEHILLGLIREGDGVAAQVLVRLGADLNRVRQQVIQLLHEYQGQDVGSAGSRLGERVRTGLPDDALARFDALDPRLTALERWVSMQPDLEDLDQEIAQVRREKAAAIERQDFENSALLRDKEKQLLAARADREKEWAGSAAGRRTVARELDRLNTELERLRATLREHGIEPGDAA
jgi:ATP-dependent Clp protease ATP-binding subunit ClpC